MMSRRWKMIGHILRKDRNDDCNVAMSWAPEDKRRKGNTKNHLKTYSRERKAIRDTPVILTQLFLDSRVVVSCLKLNFREDLHWVPKRTRKFPCKYPQVVKQNLHIPPLMG